MIDWEQAVGKILACIILMIVSAIYYSIKVNIKLKINLNKLENDLTNAINDFIEKNRNKLLPNKEYYTSKQILDQWVFYIIKTSTQQEILFIINSLEKQIQGDTSLYINQKTLLRLAVISYIHMIILTNTDRPLDFNWFQEK
ncbi:MAG: hypothetical protein LBM19_04785 [Holosporales bacterium]|jgi:hypothetical protein|nr:hypothetical protein [Holosporales bacterium]